MRHIRPLKRKWAASSLKTCAKMPVAQFHQLSHTLNPPPPEKSGRVAPKKQTVRADGVLPPHPQSSVRPLLIFPDFRRKRFELCSVHSASLELPCAHFTGADILLRNPVSLVRIAESSCPGRIIIAIRSSRILGHSQYV